ncbi:hypothetical protein SynMITS9220_02379 [Synechococcus sp. MIT S9220]|nr:hypothetical protein SynMITS9220_02379 [Synechococcus sp. MIT S9220]
MREPWLSNRFWLHATYEGVCDRTAMNAVIQEQVCGFLKRCVKTDSAGSGVRLLS